MNDLISRQDAIDTVRYSPIIEVQPAYMLIDKTDVLKNIIMLPSTQPEIIRCKDCKYFELDHFEKVDGFPIPIVVAHEICMKWGEGCKSNINGWCFMAERKTDE